MKFKEIIKVVDRTYRIVGLNGFGLLRAIQCGDHLAEHIYQKLKEDYDPKSSTQMQDALDVLHLIQEVVVKITEDFRKAF